ncbi:MAG TPA: HAD-IA family hydrolase [Dehalococcoidia bacterium]|nr:HAD-IA family hydrolase [Dehalococcoidia bacterium]
MPDSSDAKLLIDPREFDAVLFDMDGVVTRTATLHSAAWKRVFDAFLKERSGSANTFRPFDEGADYLSYVDGKPRYDGVLSFLASRGISLPYGTPDDPPQLETVCGVGNRKELVFQSLLDARGVEVYESTIALISSLRAAGLKTGVFSASRHAEQMLSAARLLSLFDERLDGIDAERLGLPGKPDPATLLELAKRLQVSPTRTVVVEDAVAGVQAARAGAFALVVGINRTGKTGSLLENGADVEVIDLSEVELASSP